MKKALITGITGQDGSYLTEFLLNKNYEVHGIIRRASSFNTQRIYHIYSNPNLKLHFGDMTDALAVDDLIKNLQPDEIYHLAAQSHVKVSFELPRYTAEVDAIGTLNVLEAVRKHSPKSRVYNACTSELFGKAQEIPQKETTRFYPRSPYGVAKLYSYWILQNYVESYGIYAVNGILFNHESERRGETFVTRKITIALSKLSNNYQVVKNRKQIIPPVHLGNIYSKRDWGYAPDYVEAMWMMLQQEKPDHYVISTGETHTIKEFIDEAIKYTPFDGKTKWEGEGIGEKLLYDDKIILVQISPKYYRPAEVELLVGDSYKARTELGWKPSVTFHELVRKMMQHDLENFNR
ncbi:MAG TPA: GDP-mannose 4,6-dehydratase [Candidatus Paceibacterota bacterium]|nr:GDP-mannose 4,6-dehydratase [Candidatus Paceibacterota bacterium]